MGFLTPCVHKHVLSCPPVKEFWSVDVGGAAEHSLSLVIPPHYTWVDTSLLYGSEILYQALMNKKKLGGQIRSKFPGQLVVTFYNVPFPGKGRGQHAVIMYGVMSKNLSCDWSVCIGLRGCN